MKTDTVVALTVDQILQLAGAAAQPHTKAPEELPGTETERVTFPWQIGKIYLIRTVTMIDTGRLVGVSPQELVLEDAAWIADTGRFAQAVEAAEFGEVEPFPSGRVIVGRGSVIDAVEIMKIQRSQK